MRITFHDHYKSCLALFLFIIVIHLPWIDFDGVIAGDTNGYMDVAKYGYLSEYIYIRPLVYPALIFLSKLILPTTFGALVYFQVLLYAFSCLLFYLLLLKYQTDLPKYISLTITAIAFSVPQVLGYNEVILPEILPLLFILFLIHFLLKPANLLNAIIVSLLIVLSIFTKPLWLLLLIFPISRYLYSQKNTKNLVYGFILPTFLVIAVYSLNQVIVSKQNTNRIAASTFDMNANLSLIRMGIIEENPNSELYGFLKNKNLIDEISGREWDNSEKEFERFTEIKDQIPGHYREDPSFWKEIMGTPSNLFSYLSFQASRIPIFFRTSGADFKVKFLPEPFNRFYQGVFYNIHSKHLIGLSFIIFVLLINPSNFKKWTFNKSIFFLIIGPTIVICFLVYQNQHFLRMRAVIEPLIIYVFLFTIYKFVNWIKRYLLAINQDRIKPNNS